MSSNGFDIYFRDLFEKTSDIIHFLNFKGEIEFVNPSWLKNLEYSFEEVKGRPIYDFIFHNHRQLYFEKRDGILYNHKRNTGATELEFCFESRSGNLITVEGVITRIQSADAPIYTRGVFKNITYKKVAERLLDESNQRMSLFFKNAPDAVILIDKNQVIKAWNPKAEIIFGFTAHEVLGELLSETIIPQQYRAAHKKGMAHYLQTGEGPVLNKTIEITALHKQGYEFPINLSISDFRINGDVFFMAFLTDITGRKKIERELIIKEAELLQSKLSDEKKDEFLSIASHELKTPLTTIKAYAQLALRMSEGETNKTIKGYLQKIDIHISKLNYLITELLDISKIQAGQFLLSKTVVAFQPYLTDILQSIQHITTTHQIQLKTNVSVKVNIDVFRIEQVIINLINNAAKYSPGKQIIEVETYTKNNSVFVSVKDYGIGIPESDLENIFSRFYRVNGVSQNFSGLGIGLFISKEIIGRHDGTITVQSEEGTGSTFTLSLPVAG